MKKWIPVILIFIIVSVILFILSQAGLFKTMKFNMLVIVVLLSIVVAAEPAVTFFLIMLAYVLSGPFISLWLRKKGSASEPAKADGADTPSKEPL